MYKRGHGRKGKKEEERKKRKNIEQVEQEIRLKLAASRERPRRKWYHGQGWI